MDPKDQSPAKFFLLVTILSIPFWSIGILMTWQPLPGIPVSAFMFVCPCVAALMLVSRKDGFKRAKQWVRDALCKPRHRDLLWLSTALLLPLSVMLASYIAMLQLGLPLPPISMDFRSVPIVFLAFALSGLAEQLGWSAYATDALQQRHGVLFSSLVVGTAWAAWHIVPLCQAGRPADWILWWCVMTMSLRVVLSWLYNSSGRNTVAVALCQASANTSWLFFPNYGSHYDPKVAGLAFGLLAVVIAISLSLRRQPREIVQ